MIANIRFLSFLYSGSDLSVDLLKVKLIFKWLILFIKPIKYLLSILVFCVVNQPLAIAEDKIEIIPGMATEKIIEGLDSNYTEYLKKLLEDEKERRLYLNQYHIFSSLLQELEKLTPLEKENVKVELANQHYRIVRDAVIKGRLDSMELDIEELARERYEVKKGGYLTQRKIKLAQIYMRKTSENDSVTRKKMIGLLRQLEHDNLEKAD